MSKDLVKGSIELGMSKDWWKVRKDFGESFLDNFKNAQFLM